MNKKSLSESDICDRFISPALISAGWDETRWRREYPFTAGRIIVRGELIARGTQKRADYLLFYKSNIPIAIIEAKDNNDNLFLEESADLLFHYLMLLQAKGFKLSDVVKILEKRHKA